MKRPQMTPWFACCQKPTRSGLYETKSVHKGDKHFQWGSYSEKAEVFRYYDVDACQWYWKSPMGYRVPCIRFFWWRGLTKEY